MKNLFLNRTEKQNEYRTIIEENMTCLPGYHESKTYLAAIVEISRQARGPFFFY